MVRLRVPLGVVLTIVLLCPTLARAQSVSAPVLSQAQPDEVRRVREELDKLRREFDVLRRAYDERLLQLEQRLAQIGGGPSVTPAPSGTDAPPASPQSPTPPQTTLASKVFNPDISVNGNFIAAAGRNPFATLSPLQLSEVEAAFQSVVDPYARADFYLAAGEEGVEVEEGFVTFTALPARLQLKAGKLRAQFGKVNVLHTHSLPSADRPLVTANLVGGDEGLSDAGVSLSHLVQHPSLFLELTGEIFAGHSEVFQSVERKKLVYLGRVRGYRDLTESSNIDIGTSVAFGPTTVEVEPGLLESLDPAPTIQATGLGKRLVAVDATFRYRPLRRAIYQRLNLRTELIWSRQEMPVGDDEHAFGMYALGEYQFARRWYVGGRVDRSGRSTDASAVDKGGSVFLTFWPTEFSQIRGQFRHVRFAEGVRANEFLFQFNFSIGAHGAHVF